MDLKIFENQGYSVRVLGDNDNPLFVAKDICDALDIVDANSAIRYINEKAKGVVLKHTLKTNGGNQQVNVVTEQGLYLLIMQSRKPSAVEFQLWVTGEVLPQTRKAGSYMSQEQKEAIEYMQQFLPKEPIGSLTHDGYEKVKAVSGYYRTDRKDPELQKKARERRLQAYTKDKQNLFPEYFQDELEQIKGERNEIKEKA